MRNVSNAVMGAIVVFAAYYAGAFAVTILALPIPGPLVGLCLLLGMLFTFPKLEVPTARFVTFPLKHMSLFFVPAVLGVSIYWDDIRANALAIAIAIILTTSLSLGFTAWFAQKLFCSKLNKPSSTSQSDGEFE
ncbi:CidA/LrgA family protein [Alteromonas sp. BL110]|uniref:CidA/LrgA family protein n=1 Tax=Alteromonas sp. BL110 TaxID=1714845 RepID=UPI000E4BA0E4|nr:CidA/LrgA family protein [Alteromonas sp. BL110]AXT37810.1 CidA/LrgA family protein [Alteromonas sp. BL110]RKM80550.1 CidA/LrgA family protein [Alteromonas sp. BL110]